MRTIQGYQFGSMRGYNRSRNVLDAPPSSSSQNPTSYKQLVEETVAQFRSPNPPVLDFLNEQELVEFDFTSIQTAVNTEIAEIDFQSEKEVVGWCFENIDAAWKYKVGFKNAFVDRIIELYEYNGIEYNRKLISNAVVSVLQGTAVDDIDYESDEETQTNKDNV